MSSVLDCEQRFTEKVNEEENVEQVEQVETKEDEKDVPLSFVEKILQFLIKYLGCSNKRADVIISANKPVEMETNKNDEEVASAAI
jgi:hypothetical protein